MNATRNDRRWLFEHLCLLRALYARRGPQDRAGVISVDDAVRYAETLLARSAASTT